jgi:5-(carboxyamino)imidazole ribonucleotide synthase
VAVRSRQGEIASYPIVQNVHLEGILHATVAPAPRCERLSAEASRIARVMLDALEYVGVIAIELFETRDGLLANEIAPRVHNSGHWTIEGAEISQFENHLRAVAGLPLGATAARGMSAMLNFIGEAPPTANVLAVPGAHLHLYGKEPRPGRKIGHVTVVAPSTDTLRERLDALAQAVPAARDAAALLR